MHWYKFHIGDYRRDTAHLSPIEHYIYRQLIDWYYLDEQPIPLETDSVLRRLRLGAEYQAELINVLSDFFEMDDDGYRKERIDSEIRDYQAQCDKNKTNAKQGGRPKKNKKTESVSSRIPNHKPTTTNHKPSREAKPKDETTVFEYMLTKTDFGTATMEAEAFFNYYESNGWKVGKNPMKDWKAAARRWLSNNQKKTASTKTRDISNVQQLSDRSWAK